ncbi:MAG: CsbD family protein [Actinobacteria bacterium]|nr:CsbD family protein [Actinomycetota bacterium]
MSALDKAKNAAKGAEGKAEEAVGHATGDRNEVAKGQAKQSSADLKNAGEKVKDAFKH